LAGVLGHMLFAINAEYATDATIVPAGAEIACIPPVSGG
jgi:molybdopterin converting factor small subunit